jgi:hypothetical protein
MCLDLDLFGEVVITYDDVKLWLNTVPRIDNQHRANHVHDYINNYDVVNKIKRAKLDNSFYSLNAEIKDDKQNLSNAIKSSFKYKFKPLAILPRSMHRA